MLEQIVIPCEDGDIVYSVDFDRPVKVVNFDQLDYDLEYADLEHGQFAVKLPEDTYDYDNHKWETPKGKLIGEIFAEIDSSVGVMRGSTAAAWSYPVE